ncbi:MAG: DNA repair helicase XPB [Planctomycetota bacterium]
MTLADRPLIPQSDLTIVLETDHPGFAAMREGLLPFAELEKSPEHLHTYRITPVSIWNAAATGRTARKVLHFLEKNSRYGLPPNFKKEIETWFSRCGIFELEAEDGRLLLSARKTSVLRTLLHDPELAGLLEEADPERGRAFLPRAHRGLVKRRLIRLGYPVTDRAGYVEGDPLELRFCEELPGGDLFTLRDYQKEAVEAFHCGGSLLGGSGVIVLPCGAGKTVVGMAVMELLQTQTLVLTPNIVALRQWRKELVEKTSLEDHQIGEYSGEVKEIRPVTLSTYQILTYRRSREEGFLHFDLFQRANWGLIIYDEVHLLPAPVFRTTADLQARRRLGLTATLVREDGLEEEVFCLIGPKRYDSPWKDLERRGFIAEVECTEVRVLLEGEARVAYLASTPRRKFRIASENPAKNEVLKALLHQLAGRRILIIGQYLSQLHCLQQELGVPLITGRTPTAERERLYGDFRKGVLEVLMVSKVGNFAIDLPDANVAIQISGTFGSRQEEAQRIGRILRPKTDGSRALFYSLVTESSLDQDYADKRQRFLTEQGYRYTILPAQALLSPESAGSA